MRKNKIQLRVQPIYSIIIYYVLCLISLFLMFLPKLFILEENGVIIKVIWCLIMTSILMFTDENGEGIFFVLFLAAFTVVGAGVGLGVGVSQGHEGWQLVGDVALGAAAGLFTGSLTASILGAYGVVAGKALILGMKPISTWALGSAIYDLLGFTIAPILRIDFVPIEYDGGKDYAIPDNMPPAIIRPYSTYVVGDYNG